MFIDILLQVLFCVFIIIMIHYLWEYLKNKMTIHKKKNVIDIEIQKYKNMIDEITSSKPKKNENTNEINVFFQNNIDTPLNINDVNSNDLAFSSETIKNDLQNYMNEIGFI